MARSKSPIGWLPGLHDLDLAELEIDRKRVDELLEIDHEKWKTELAEHKKFFDSLGGVVPEELLKQCDESRFQVRQIDCGKFANRLRSGIVSGGVEDC